MKLRERIGIILRNVEAGAVFREGAIDDVLSAVEEALPPEMPYPSTDFFDGGNPEYRDRREAIEKTERAAHNSLLNTIKSNLREK